MECKRRLYLVGHSHVDVAWLWPIEETKQVIRKLFNHVLELMEKYPYFTFAQSTALYYEWVSEDKQLLNRIREFIKKGRWEVVGGSWVECDCNMLSGESLVRQFLYGLRFLKKLLGVDVKVAWFPDSFGIPATMPQILKDCGIRYLVIQKLNWNDTVLHPYNIYWWEGLDGSKVLTYQTVGGYSDDPRDIENLKVLFFVLNLRQQLDDLLLLYGIGDHGGGPTEDMVRGVEELSRRLRDFGIIEVRHVKSEDYMRIVEERYGERIPKFKGELYLQFHRGTYTSQVKLKEYIKKCEYLIEILEKALTMRYLVNGEPYDKSKLESLWRTFLTTQFHDVLAGSLSKTPYAQFRKILNNLALRLKGEVEETLKSIIEHNIGIDQSKFSDKYAILIFNPTPRGREAFIDLTDKDTRVPKKGNSIVKVKVHGLSLSMIPMDHLKTKKEETDIKVLETSDHVVLENRYIRLVIEKRSGKVTSIYSKELNTEYLEGKGLRFEIYEDTPIPGRTTMGTLKKFFDFVFDCWEVYAFQYHDKVRSHELVKPLTVKVVENGPLRASALIEYLYSDHEGNYASIKHYLRLYSEKRWIEGIVEIEWKCTHKMLKLCMDLNYWVEDVVVGQPFGHVVRRNPASPYSTLFDRSKWEANFNGWIDYSDGRRGLSIICATRFGYDLMNRTIRLTLLRAPRFPPEWGTPWSKENQQKQEVVEQEKHSIKYYIYLHRGNWIEGKVPTISEDLIIEPYVLTIKGKSEPFKMWFLEVKPEILSIPVIKLSEENNYIILRLVNYYNCTLSGKIQIAVNKARIVEATIVDMLERDKAILKHQDGEVEVILKPYEIKTIKLRIKHKV